MAEVKNPEKLAGKYVRLREVTVDDAAFILELRLQDNARYFLHRTENDVQKQIDYISRYLTLDNEWYFIVERVGTGERIGCIGVLDVHDDGAETGRWIMKPSKDIRPAVETKMLVSDFVFNELNLSNIRTYTRKDNVGQISVYKVWGYDTVGEKDGYVYFNLSKETYNRQRPKMLRFL